MIADDFEAFNQAYVYDLDSYRRESSRSKRHNTFTKRRSNRRAFSSFYSLWSSKFGLFVERLSRCVFRSTTTPLSQQSIRLSSRLTFGTLLSQSIFAITNCSNLGLQIKAVTASTSINSFINTIPSVFLFSDEESVNMPILIRWKSSHGEIKHFFRNWTLNQKCWKTDGYITLSSIDVELRLWLELRSLGCQAEPAIFPFFASFASLFLFCRSNLHVICDIPAGSAVVAIDG
ncbi:uncharacterized protein LAJ45_10409 [Morchella importuna]|uniref:uncharacterized protein n=1 Tax=Morchella importuna TaxID=1174673 RepID=UPI001E8D1E71|nr:uncharacterized protein LAJ45_10409 [Morchella importuna]KAH8145608.1 hypothetical protein LAJ45_10409 [Morchella importuna]